MRQSSSVNTIPAMVFFLTIGLVATAHSNAQALPSRSFDPSIYTVADPFGIPGGQPGSLRQSAQVQSVNGGPDSAFLDELLSDEPRHVTIKDFNKLPPAIKAHVENMSPAQQAEFRQRLQSEGIIVTAAMLATEPADTPRTPEQIKAEALLGQLMKLKGLDRRPSQILKSMAMRLATSERAKGEDFQRQIVVGEWEDVSRQLSHYPQKVAASIYSHLLGLLMGSGETLLPSDIIALADASPTELDRKQLALLGRLLRESMRQIDEPTAFLSALKSGTKRLGGSRRKSQASAARLLIAAGMMKEAKDFLPPLVQDAKEMDPDQINLHALFQQTVGQEESNMTAYRKAWKLTQAVLSVDRKKEPRAFKEAFARALSLLSRLPHETTRPWLRDLFANQPRLAMAVVACISRQVDASFNRPGAVRIGALKSLQVVLNELLVSAQAKPELWLPAVRLLANGWINEAQKTVGGEDRKIVRAKDNEVSPLEPDTLLPLAPDEVLLEMLDRDTARHLRRLTGFVAARAGNKELCFAIIRQVADYDPETATTLAESYFQSWTDAENMQGVSVEQYMRQYQGQGYSSQQLRQVRFQLRQQLASNGNGGMPLTRAKQVRGLQRLAALLEEINALDLPALDAELLVAAFAGCHSPAEVYRDEDIERVFGPIASLETQTAMKLASAAREHLAGQWRKPETQQSQHTGRTDEELIAEIKRGYNLSIRMLEAAVERETDNPDLFSLLGTVYFDHAEFLYGQEVDLETYISTRDRAFASFQRAHEAYADRVAALPQDKQSVSIYQVWFQSGLGASDLAYLTRQDEPDRNQIDQIAAAIRSLGGSAVDRHLTLFGEALNETADQVPSHLKPWFLREGIRILGDHESGAPMRELLEFYQELLTEIELHLQIDGSADVGHGDSFGAHLFIRNTIAVGRESGGFTMLLDKSYSQATRQQIDYKEKIEQEIRGKLSEGFEIQQIRFHDPTVVARGFGREGWRQTPLAYVVLRAKDPAIDRIPSLQIDLEFADGRGSVLLPISSQVQLIDARKQTVAPRPYSELKVRQTLDDRALDDGKLTLEIVATAKGLIPELDELLVLPGSENKHAITGFSISNMDDHGVSVVGMNTERQQVMPLCERTWTVELAATDERLSGEFRFPNSRQASAEIAYLRYDDADIVDAEQIIPLPRTTLAGGRGLWIALVIGGVVVVGAGAVIAMRIRRKTACVDERSGLQRPDLVTPFTVVTVLKRLRADYAAALSEDQLADLSASINRLEHRFFTCDTDLSSGDNLPINGELEELLDSWLCVSAQGQ